MNALRNRLITVLLISLSLNAWTEGWSRYRGPNGTGISKATGIPSNWNEGDYLWKLKLPGTGHSSPVLWDSKLFVTSAVEAEGVVVLQCLDSASGEEIWRTTVPFKPYRQHRYNRFASSTPVVNGQHVYLWQPGPESSQFHAFNLEGKPVWTKESGPVESQHGGGSSPVVFENQIVLANDHLGQSFLLSMDATTGRENWRINRDSDMAAYGAPCVFDVEGRPSLLIFNSKSHGITAIDPFAGRVVWENKTLFNKRSVSSSLMAAGLLIGSCGSGGGGNYIVAVRPPDQPGSEPELVWTIRRSAPYVPTSLAYGNDLFLWSDGGLVSCVDAPTGKVIWNERVGGDYFGSPVWVEGRLFAISSTGEVVVVTAARDFKILGRTSLGEGSHATPALDGTRMYLRTLSQIFCVGS